VPRFLTPELLDIGERLFSKAITVPSVDEVPIHWLTDRMTKPAPTKAGSNPMVIKVTPSHHHKPNWELLDPLDLCPVVVINFSLHLAHPHVSVIGGECNDPEGMLRGVNQVQRSLIRPRHVLCCCVEPAQTNSMD
jgi:hypothetical protein